MTLTEEQRPTAGFDLEKARDVEKAMSPMPWIVLEEAHGEMIIIRNPNHPMYIDGIVAWGRVAEANTPDAIGIAYMRENFSNLIGEIERLRASLIDLHAEYINTLEKNPECSAWDLDEQSDADQRRLRRNAAHAISIVEPPIYLQAEQQAARIKELEDALVENLAADIAYDDRLLWSRLDGQRQDEYREKARQQLQAGGKIGPDASESHLRPYEVVAADLAGRLAEDRRKSWQITEERKAAIWHAVAVLKENDPDDEHLWDEEIAVLRAMLREAE